MSDLKEMIDRYYDLPGNGAGGNLHIALEDPNYDDNHIEWCRDRAAASGDELGAQIANALLAMPLPERRAFLGWTLAEGYASDDEEEHFKANPSECPHNWAPSMTGLDGVTRCMGCDTILRAGAPVKWLHAATADPQ